MKTSFPGFRVPEGRMCLACLPDEVRYYLAPLELSSLGVGYPGLRSFLAPPWASLFRAFGPPEEGAKHIRGDEAEGSNGGWWVGEPCRKLPGANALVCGLAVFSLSLCWRLHLARQRRISIPVLGNAQGSPGIENQSAESAFQHLHATVPQPGHRPHHFRRNIEASSRSTASNLMSVMFGIRGKRMRRAFSAPVCWFNRTLGRCGSPVHQPPRSLPPPRRLELKDAVGVPAKNGETSGRGESPR